MAAGADQPDYVLKGSGKGKNCLMCDQALARRAKVFPLSRGNGKNYFNVHAAQRFMHELSKLEESMFIRADYLMERSYEQGKLDKDSLPLLYIL